MMRADRSLPRHRGVSRGVGGVRGVLCTVTAADAAASAARAATEQPAWVEEKCNVSALADATAAAAAQPSPDYRLGGDVDYDVTGDILLRER